MSLINLIIVVPLSISTPIITKNHLAKGGAKIHTFSDMCKFIFRISRKVCIFAA